MDNEEIMYKAIEKAWKNGYQGCKRVTQWHYLAQKGNLESIIFSHDFAKAFWGEEHNWEQVTTFNTECKKCGMVGETGWNVVDRCWESALKQMVLEENPIKYLEKFL